NRFAAISAPILPRPINPIAAMLRSSHYRIALSRELAPVSILGKSKLALADRGEVAIDRRIGDLGERRRAPARLLVLVNDDRAHPLIEILPGHDMLGQPVFE